MTQLSKISFGVLLVGALFANAPRPACAGWIYVGSWDVSDGPSVNTNPIVYSAVEYAAVRFGGVGSDYQISSISPGVSRTPNRMAWYAGWATLSLIFWPTPIDWIPATGVTTPTFPLSAVRSSIPHSPLTSKTPSAEDTVITPFVLSKRSLRA